MWGLLVFEAAAGGNATAATNSDSPSFAATTALDEKTPQAKRVIHINPTFTIHPCGKIRSGKV
jgi:hypothetical protein